MRKKVPAYTPLERLDVSRPVDRISWLAAAARGKQVLDLGAMDETAYESKLRSGFWLHEEVARTAMRVIGIDSSTLIPAEGINTFPNARIEKVNVHELGSWLDRVEFEPEIIIAGELLEHLENPLNFLRMLKCEAKLAGKTLILTTPNATAFHNCLIATLGMESTHHDHLSIFSYKTLWTLMSRAGLDEWEIIPYRSSFVEMKRRRRGLGRALINCGETVVNVVEHVFPLLSFGYIVRGKI